MRKKSEFETRIAELEEALEQVWDLLDRKGLGSARLELSAFEVGRLRNRSCIRQDKDTVSHH